MPLSVSYSHLRAESESMMGYGTLDIRPTQASLTDLSCVSYLDQELERQPRLIRCSTLHPLHSESLACARVR